MNINLECIRTVIKYCADNIDYNEGIDNTWGEDFVDLCTLYSAKELESFPKKDIMYSVLKLYEYKYIVLSNVYPINKPYIERCTICDITIYGHNFLNSIEEDTIWNKTKNIIGKASNYTLKFVEQTAQMIATESAKQAVTIMMAQQ